MTTHRKYDYGKEVEELKKIWASERFQGITRPYSAEDVIALRGSIKIEHTFAKMGCEKLWEMLNKKDVPGEHHIKALGAMTGNQAVQQAKAGLKAIYLSGWQVAADANLSGHTYPDQSLYPCNSVPAIVNRINNAFARADQIQHSEKYASRTHTPANGHSGDDEGIDYFLPIVADAEAGFGGALNVFELMKQMITAGAAGVHFEDQLASEKKCGHMGGKVLLSVGNGIKNLVSARLAADVLGVNTVIVARTDANGAHLITSDHDPRDKPFLTGKRTQEGFYTFKGGLDAAIQRGLAYAPYSDVIWCETAEPSIEEAKRFADAIHEKFPGKLLAYNCSPSFNWRAKLDEGSIASFQDDLGRMGYKFQFVTLAGFHSLAHSMFKLSQDYKQHGMTAYSALQQAEFRSESDGYTATKHQREVGTAYFDKVALTLSGGQSSTVALVGSTEEDQFKKNPAKPKV